MNVLEGAWFTLQGLLSGVFSADWFAVAMKFFPFVALFELPVQATARSRPPSMAPLSAA